MLFLRRKYDYYDDNERGSKNYEMFFGLELGENKRFSSIKESERSSSSSSFCSFCWAQGRRGVGWEKPKKKGKFNVFGEQQKLLEKIVFLALAWNNFMIFSG